jgi:L-threo-3-deoxy-hexylosonate aldolase
LFNLPNPIHSLIHPRVHTDPGASAGIDLDSDLVEELAASCPNLSGVKLTCVASSEDVRSHTLHSDRCGSIGKLTRIAAAVADPTFDNVHPRKNPSAPFLVLGGFADIITSSAFVHGHGAIAGLANIAPVSGELACSAVD